VARHDLTSIKHRLKALAAKVLVDGILSRRPKPTGKPHRELESECPGYCDAQNTFPMSAP
jgi:hypothetical protein